MKRWASTTDEDGRDKGKVVLGAQILLRQAWIQKALKAWGSE